jgi:hypothetical protein
MNASKYLLEDCNVMYLFGIWLSAKFQIKQYRIKIF